MAYLWPLGKAVKTENRCHVPNNLNSRQVGDLDRWGESLIAIPLDILGRLGPHHRLLHIQITT